MKAIRKKKSISKKYSGISVNEKDLSYLSKLVYDVALKDNASILIEITSSDKEDVYSSENHTIFYSNDIPKNIDSINISLIDYRSPTRCRIELDPNFFKPAQVTIYGEDSEVINSLFREIDRELVKLKFQDILKFKYLNSFWYSISLGVILAAAVYSFFDFILVNLDAFVQGFDGSVWDKSIAMSGWILIGLTVIAGGIYATSILQKIFPRIRFSGKFEDRYKTHRKNLIWIVVIIIIPILLNLLSNFLWM